VGGLSASRAGGPPSALRIMIRTIAPAGSDRLPAPGASTMCSRDVASTVRLEIVTGSGFVSQFAPGRPVDLGDVFTPRREEGEGTSNVRASSSVMAPSTSSDRSVPAAPR